jgi:hypothetical protein
MKRPLRKVFSFPIIVFALLLVTACGQSAHTSPARSITSQLQLTCHAIKAPEGVLTVAPGDGDVAYICNMGDGSHIAIWVTRDRATRWTHTADIPVRAGATVCDVTIDGLQPDTAVVAVTSAKPGGSPPISAYTNYVTFDGGSTWRELAGSQPYLAFQFSTRAGVIYGYLRVSDGQQDIPELATSSDHMRTWHLILQHIADFGGFGSTAFWLNPANGAVLVEDMAVFWSSAIVGANWTKITAPGSGSPAVVQAPVDGQPWHLCAAKDDDQNLKNPKPNTLMCSIDGGQTWQSVPALNIAFTNAKGTFVTPAGVFALASDGAVLARSSSSAGPWTTGDYRLAANAQQWQPLNLAPGSSADLRYYPAPGDGVLWAWAKQAPRTASYP